MGTHLRVLSESYLLNTNMTGFRKFSKYLCPCSLDRNSLSIGRVKGLNTSCIGILVGQKKLSVTWGFHWGFWLPPQPTYKWLDTIYLIHGRKSEDNRNSGIPVRLPQA